ncbi:NAD(P)/FAD-dependent oxidoreductase [Caldimonas brevitalea]|uniref:Amine oxidase domain-containing protein n=1 Tax=Caldimonas brevitalea TaxID=413882 RepID=A0A0G3BI13_9BURK|nr:FAD-dependent oxidoreductase [Caldimonas brevitalea]AKJ26996.1 hypothetical protein AAW51_0305 [Caldimonas brevitalea]
MTRQRIAVIGAGLAGLACARRLQDAGQAVTVFEQQPVPGGRCASHASPAGVFDHGANGFGAVGATFCAQVRAWAEQGWVGADPQTPERWVTTGPMQSLPERLAQGCTLALPVDVAAVEREQAHWRLRTHNPLPLGLDPCFDAVVVTLPAERAVTLLAADPALAAAAREVKSEPCWTAMVAWPGPLPLRTARLDPAALAAAGGVLSAAWRDDDRPARAPVSGVGARWVLQASPYWSANNLDARPADVARRLLDAFATALSAKLARPVYSATHLWRHAWTGAPRAEPYGWNDELHLGVCGDAWHALDGAEGVERAWLSGSALAEAVLAQG